MVDKEMSDATIDLGSLCVIVVVVFCSWGLALLCSLTCWNSYKKSKPSHIYCIQCSTLQHYVVPPHPAAIPPLQYANQTQVNQHQALPHTTAERLGIVEHGRQPVVLRSCDKRYPMIPSASFGAGIEVLETIPDPSPHGDECLDQHTTISRSFRSAVKRKRSSINGKSPSRETAGRDNFLDSSMTLNERFGTYNNQLLGPEEGVNANANTSDMSIASAQSKLSQVRILTSPLPNDSGGANQDITRTPSNAMRSTRKSLFSSKSVKSFLGSKSKCNKTRSSSINLSNISTGGAKSRVMSCVSAKGTNGDFQGNSLKIDDNKLGLS